MALKPTLSRQFLQKRIGDRNIFNFYFGDFEFDRSYHSVFRQDEKASTGFYLSEHGSIIYNDFTTGDKYDCVKFVMKLLGLNYYKAMEQIAVDFGIIPGTRSTTKAAVLKPIEAAKAKRKKEYLVTVTKFRPHHIQYWEQYGITEAELKAVGIKAVAGIKVDGYELPVTINELRFFYPFKDPDTNAKYFKVYSPQDNVFKWMGPVPLHLIFGISDLTFASDRLVITKSVKDCLVLRKFFPEVIGLQNESKSAIKREMMAVLKKQYKYIYTWFDCDKTGIEASEYFRKTYGTTPLFTPTNSYVKHKVKDPSDFVKQYGLANFALYLKTLKV